MRISVILVCLMLIVSVVSASPLTDYSQGKTAIDITWRPNLSLDYDWHNGPYSIDGKRSNFDWAITTGLGGKYAVQFRQYNPVCLQNEAWNPEGMKNMELNLLYKLNKNVSAFAGYNRSQYYWHDATAYSAKNNNQFQAGLVGSTKIAPKTVLYGIVGMGRDIKSYETGLSYGVAKNLDFNLSYRYIKADNLESTWGNETYKSDITAKGFGYGLTYTF